MVFRKLCNLRFWTAQVRSVISACARSSTWLYLGGWHERLCSKLWFLEPLALRFLAVSWFLDDKCIFRASLAPNRSKLRLVFVFRLWLVVWCIPNLLITVRCNYPFLVMFVLDLIQGIINKMQTMSTAYLTLFLEKIILILFFIVGPYVFKTFIVCLFVCLFK